MPGRTRVHRASFSWFCADRFNHERNLARADIKNITNESITLMILPCKNMRHLNGKTAPLVLGAGGRYIDAVAEIKN